MIEMQNVFIMHVYNKYNCMLTPTFALQRSSKYVL